MDIWSAGLVHSRCWVLHVFTWPVYHYVVPAYWKIKSKQKKQKHQPQTWKIEMEAWNQNNKKLPVCCSVRDTITHINKPLKNSHRCMASAWILNFLPLFVCGHPSIFLIRSIRMTEEFGENHAWFNDGLTWEKKSRLTENRESTRRTVTHFTILLRHTLTHNI